MSERSQRCLTRPPCQRKSNPLQIPDIDPDVIIYSNMKLRPRRKVLITGTLQQRKRGCINAAVFTCFIEYPLLVGLVFFNDLQREVFNPFVDVRIFVCADRLFTNALEKNQ